MKPIFTPITSWWARVPYRKQVWLFLAPYLAGTAILVLAPTLATVYVAFTEYDAIQAPAWVGLANFARLWASPLVRRTLRNTLIFVGLAVPLRLAGALALALLLRPKGRFFRLCRAAVYLPTVIPNVAYALIWLWIFNPVQGPLNLLLGSLGLPTPDWLANAATARLALVIMAAFQIGEGFVVVLAGLHNIPPALYEVARVDGASDWQALRHITLPLLIPWLTLLIFRDTLVSLQNTFTPSFVMTYGGPYYATTFVPLLVYELAFDFFDFGLASAVLIVAYVLIGLLIGGALNTLGTMGAGRDV